MLNAYFVSFVLPYLFHNLQTFTIIISKVYFFHIIIN